MENPTSVEHNASTSADLQGHDDAIALESDLELWVMVEDYGPITLNELIEVNAQPGVTPITHFAATAIRSLEIGDTYEDFGDAAITRVAKP